MTRVFGSDGSHGERFHGLAAVNPGTDEAVPIQRSGTVQPIERDLRGACAEVGVRYWRPDFDHLSLDHGQGFYEALSWLTGCLDGYRGGRQCPLELPVRDPDGAIVDDARSVELWAQIEEPDSERQPEGSRFAQHLQSPEGQFQAPSAIIDDPPR